MKRRLAVIFMADMVDYSRLMEADQPGTITLIRELRDRWLEPLVQRRDGLVLKRMGDGWIIAFSSVTDAVETAQDVQTSLAGHEKIRLRLAIHLGEIIEDDEDIYGTGINIAARLQTEAPPGGVMISGDLHRQLDARLAEGFSDAGNFELKNISHPVAALQWRPSAPEMPALDEVPVIAVEPISAVPDQPEAREAASDLQEQLVFRLTRRTGVHVLSLDEEGAGEPTYLVRGRLRADSTAAKVTLSLMIRETGRVVWSDVYEGSSDDLFGLVDQAAERTDDELRLSINMLDGERLSALSDDALSVSELRSRAAYCFYAVTLRGYERAVDLLDRALRLAPADPASMAMLAHAWVWLLTSRFDLTDTKRIARVASQADKAVQLAPRSDFVIKARAEVRLKLLGDIESAKRSLDRALQVNPGYSALKMTEAEISLAEGDWDRVAELVTTYVVQNPRSPDLPYALYVGAVGELLAGHYEPSVRRMEDAIARRPASRPYFLLLAEIHRRAGNSTAEAAARSAAAELPSEPDIAAPRLFLPRAEASLMGLLLPS